MKPNRTKLLPLLLVAGTLFQAAEVVAGESGAAGPSTPGAAKTSPGEPDGVAGRSQKLADTRVTAGRAAAPAKRADRDATAFRMPGTLHETPRSVAVVDAERIRERDHDSLDDLMDSVPGIFVNSRNAGGYHFIARGFRMAPTDTRLDGFRGIYAGGGQNPLPLYGVDRVVFLKGPDSILYGSAGAPGGIINIITRKPEEIQKTTLDFTAGTYHGNGLDFGDRASVGAELDSTGPLSDEFLYRAGLAGDSSGHYTAGVTNQTRFGLAAITWKPLKDDRVKVTPLLQHYATRTPPGAGMVMSPSTSLSTNDGSSRVNTDDLTSLAVNPYDGLREDEVAIAGFDLNAGDRESVALNAGYRFIRYDTAVNTWSPVVNTAGQRATLVNTGLVSRTQTKREALSDGHNFDINATLASRPARAWKNELMLGLNGRHADASSRNAAGPLATPQSPINIHTGAAATPPADNATGWQPWSDAESCEWNSYLQDRAALFDERLVLTFGVGYGQLHTAGRNTLRGEVTPNAAALWNITRELATYAAYSTSHAFADAATLYEDAAGDAFTPDPTAGDNKEVGLKCRVPEGKSTATLAFFRAERTDVLTQSPSGDLNPNGNRYYFMQPGQRTEGAELSSSVYLTDDWNLDAAFARITGSYRNGTEYDQPLAKTPEYSFSLFSRHRFTSGSLKGFGHYLGVTWQDKRLGGNGSRTAAAPDPLSLPAFHRVDAGLNYTVNEHLRVAFHIHNLLDEVILVDGTTGANLQVDAPRTYTLRATFTF